MNNIKTGILFYLVVIMAVTLLSDIALAFSSLKAGVAHAKILAWEDNNRNGIKDENEKGIPGACVNSGLLYSGSQYISDYYNCIFKTDGNGEITIDFHSGPCWQVYNIVLPPSGYAPTTPNTNIGCTTRVGFTKGIYKSDNSKYKSFVWQEATKLKVMFWLPILTCSILVSELLLLANRAIKRYKYSKSKS